MKHLISINDLEAKEIFEEILPGCKSMIPRARERKIVPRPEKKVIFAFFEPSTRTRGSYVEASRLLGWSSDVITGTEATSLSKKESMANTARMFALQGADVLVMRTKMEGAQKFIAEILEKENYNVSVQNGGDGTNQHPSQTMLDLLTISERLGGLDNFKIGFFGDLKYGRTVHSLICALAHRDNISLALASDPETALQEQYKKLFSNVSEGDSLELLKDCDVIYGSRLQEERFVGDQVALERAKKRFRINNKTLSIFKPHVIIMHPMPYVNEFAPDIRQNKQLIIDEQAWHGIPVRMYLLEEGYKNKNIKSFPDVNPDNGIQILKNIPLPEYFEIRQNSKNSDMYFLPITNGTVIDHIAHGLGLKIRQFLFSKNILINGVKHTIEDVPSGKHGLKDVLVLENIFIPEELMVGISSFDPQITFNIISEGNFCKIKIRTTKAISGIGICPNKNCITNDDPEASAKFLHRDNDGSLECYYCEKTFKQKEVI